MRRNLLIVLCVFIGLFVMAWSQDMGIKGVKKMAGIGGDGGVGLGDEGMGLGSDAGSSGMGIGTAFGGTEGETGGAAASLGFGVGEGGGVGGLSGPAPDEGPGFPKTSQPVAPVVSQVSTQTPEVVNASPKVEEAKAAVTRKARRRSLLGGEEGGLEPTNIYRRSILGS